MAQRILEQLDFMARLRPEASAITTVAPLCSAQRRMSYFELHRQVLAAASVLRASGAAGDVVMLCASNQPAFITAFLGVLRAGKTVFPVHPGLTSHEIIQAAKRAGAQMLVASARRFESLAGMNLELFDIQQFERLTEACAEPDDLPSHEHCGLMLQTSGTTGLPKIVYRSSQSLDAVARNVAESTNLVASDHLLAAMPLCHSYGVENGLLAPLMVGAAIHLADGFDPASIARHLETEGVTVFPGVPFMYQVLAYRSAPMDWPTRRLAYSAGSPMPAAVAEAFHARYSMQIGQLYGATEIGSVTFAAPDQSGCCRRDVGKPMRDVTMRILDPQQPRPAQQLPNGTEGLVAVAAPSMLDHYVDDTEPSLVDGFFLTGDLGRMDREGNLTITGRLKLQIEVGGMKVNPLEVEDVLSQHPAVRECVVVPDPVTHTLNRLKAIVSLRQPDQDDAAEQLREFVRQRLASYKVPRIIEFRDVLPKSPTGKILREALR